MSELKDLRESRGLKQKFVAGRLGLSSNNLSRYETGKVALPIAFVRPLAQIYGVPFETIFSAAYEHEAKQP